jgi:hypothetical protein
MTDKIFAVISTRGPRWNDSQPLEGQDDWSAHADFMNRLAADGFVLLGGPLEGTPDVLLIVRAADQGQVEERLAADCWTAKDLLRIRQVCPWSLRLRSPSDP